MPDTLTPDTPVIMQSLYPNGSALYNPSLTLKEAEMHVGFASKALMKGDRVMYRAFEKKPDGSEKFIKAWIVTPNNVEPYPEVTVPKEFF
jgi:hypothetical protein